jgi:Protein kinase domain
VLYSRKDAVWKLADFGLSKQLSSQSVGFTSGRHGTNGYLSPEFVLCLDDKIPFNRGLDIWSLGCILYELAVGTQLFAENYFAIRYKERGVLPDITFDEAFSDNDKEQIRSAFTRMLSLDPKGRPAARDLIEEFSLNYDSTTATQPQDIEILEEFSPASATVTTMMARTEPTITTEIEAHEVEVKSEPQAHLPVSVEERKALVSTAIEEKHVVEVRMAEQDKLPLSFEEKKALVLGAFKQHHKVDARTSESEDRPLSLQERKALALTAFEEKHEVNVKTSDPEDQPSIGWAMVIEPGGDTSSFWSWHAISIVFASNDNITGAIEACERGLTRFPNNPSIFMELMNLMAFEGKYKDAADYSDKVTKMDTEAILKALSFPESLQIGSIIPDQRRKEASLELYIPKP